MEPKVNIATIEDDEPALLLAKFERSEKTFIMLNEGEETTELLYAGYGKVGESNV